MEEVADLIAQKVSAASELREHLTSELSTSFVEIGEALGISSSEAEDVAAQAITAGLIVGRIDQLKGELNYTAGHPKTFEPHHYDETIARLKLWKQHVTQISASLD